MSKNSCEKSEMLIQAWALVKSIRELPGRDPDLENPQIASAKPVHRP